MGQGAIDYIGVKGGLDINGVIEDYYVYAGENINAGDFVEFVNGIGSHTSKTETSSDTALVGYSMTMSACKLSDTSVFIAHGSGTSESSSNYLYGIVCVINGATIKYGADTQIATHAYSGWNMDAVALTDTKVFLAYGRGSSDYLNAQVCTISGTTITLGTDTRIAGSSTYQANYVSVEALSSTKVCVIHAYGSNNYLGGQICTISDTTISAGTNISLCSASDGTYIKTAKMAVGRIFVAHGTDTRAQQTHLQGVFCTISGTTITAGTDTSLSTSGYSAVGLSVIPLDSTTVFIAYSRDSYYYLYGIVCTTSDGTTITKGAETQINGKNYSGTGISAEYLNGKIIVLHSPMYQLYEAKCSVSGTTITVDKITQLDSETYLGYRIDSEILTIGNKKTFFVAHTKTSSYNLYAQVFQEDESSGTLSNVIKSEITEYETQVKKATTLPCNGVASTSGEGGDETGHKDIVSVYQPYSAFNLVVNGDFSNGLEGWVNKYSSHCSMEIAQDNGENCLKLTALDDTDYTEIRYDIDIPLDHVYYMSAYMKGATTNDTTSTTADIKLIATSAVIDKCLKTNVDWKFISIVKTNVYSNFYIRPAISEPVAGDTAYFKKFKFYDLTAMFGAGNEPTQEWCDANL